jgi:hypothetical protein
MRTPLILGILSATLAVPCFPARAQQDPLEPPDLSRYARWGPVWVRPTLVLSNVGHDDNVFYRSGDQDAPGDYTATISPRVEGVVMLGQRAFLTFDERLDWTLYRRYSDQNFANQFGRARLTVPFQAMGLYVEGRLNRLRDRPNAELDTRTRRDEDRLEAGVILRLGWRTDLETGVFRSDWSHRDPDFTDPDFTIGDLLDRRESGARARLRYRLTAQTRLTLDADRREIDFDNPLVSRDSTRSSLMPGVQFGEGARLSGLVKVGRARVDAEDPAQPDFDGTIGEAALAWRLGIGTTVRLNARRDVGFAVYERNAYTLDETYRLGLVHYFNRVFGAEAGGSRGTLRFPGSGDDPGTDRRDDISTSDGGLRFRIYQATDGRRLEYNVRVTRFRRDSTRDGLDQTRTIVGAGVVVGF